MHFKGKLNSFRKKLNKNFFNFNLKFLKFMRKRSYGLHFLLLFLFFFKPFSILNNLKSLIYVSYLKSAKLIKRIFNYHFFFSTVYNLKYHFRFFNNLYNILIFFFKNSCIKDYLNNNFLFYFNFNYFFIRRIAFFKVNYK